MLTLMKFMLFLSFFRIETQVMPSYASPTIHFIMVFGRWLVHIEELVFFLTWCVKIKYGHGGEWKEEKVNASMAIEGKGLGGW